MLLGRTELVSGGEAGFNGLGMRAISADGRFVVFDSDSGTLVPNDVNMARDVFVRDMSTGVASIASVDSNGVQWPVFSNQGSISADGRFVAMHSLGLSLDVDWRNYTGFASYSQIFLHDRATHVTQLMSREQVTATVQGVSALGRGASERPILSADGRNIAFDSYARFPTIPQSSTGIGATPVLVRLNETTTVSIDAATPAQSTADEPLLVTVRVTGETSDPRGGTIAVTASSGETCTTSTLTRDTTTDALASCTLVPHQAGGISLVAAYADAPNYAASTSTAAGHLVLPGNDIFHDGFE
jgi:Tol biopolymer transport system component